MHGWYGIHTSCRKGCLVAFVFFFSPFLIHIVPQTKMRGERFYFSHPDQLKWPDILKSLGLISNFLMVRIWVCVSVLLTKSWLTGRKRFLLGGLKKKKISCCLFFSTPETQACRNWNFLPFVTCRTSSLLKVFTGVLLVLASSGDVTGTGCSFEIGVSLCFKSLSVKGSCLSLRFMLMWVQYFYFFLLPAELLLCKAA